MTLQRRALPLFLVLLFVAALDAQGIRTGTPESVGMSAERLARIAPAMQALVDAGQLAGAETLVARRGVIVHHASVGFADREAKRPLTPETMHRIASMTKPLTSVAIMMLFEEGRLLLSDPVSRFIPAFRETKVLVPADKTTTDVLGRVVEVASGMSLDEYFRRRIFEPLKMQDTYFTVPQAKMPRLSVLYAVEKGLVTTPGPDQGSFATTRYYSGGAGLVSTGRDYLRFAQMLLNGGELDGARILGRKTVALMMASHTQDLGPDAVGSGMGFGYGGSVRESLGRSNRPGSAGTFNWSGIFGTYFWIDPQEQLVTILMHNLNPRNNRAPDLFQTLAYAAVVN